MKYVFLVGCPRSGTTWLRMLLAQHPAVASPRETHLFDSYIAGLQAAWDMEATVRGATGLHAALTESQFTSLCADFARGVLQHIAEANPNSRIVVEKTPNHVRHVPLILKLLPDAHFIHLVRDPRAAVASLCAAGRTWGRAWASRDPLKNARVWVRDVSAGRGVASLTEHHVTVKYEALLEPEGWRVLWDLFRRVGLEVDGDFCQNALKECAIERLRKERDTLISKGMALVNGADFFRKGKADSWRDELSDHDVEVIEYVAGDLMREYGYIGSTEFVGRARKPWRLKVRDNLDRFGRRGRRTVNSIFDKVAV